MAAATPPWIAAAARGTSAARTSRLSFAGYEEINASPWEKEDADHEGVEILNWLNPKSFVREDGKLTGMWFTPMHAEHDAGRHGRDGAAAWRKFRRAQLFGRQASTGADPQAAMTHKGASFVDVISPCVAFDNHECSTRSCDYAREHNHALCRMDFISPRDAITVDYPPGEVRDVRQHDGSVLQLRKLPGSHDTGDRVTANYLHACQARGEIVTGLRYVDPEAPDLHAHFNTVDVPLNTLGEREPCPGSVALTTLNAGLR